ncbi:MAG: hypothetical protein EBR23_07285 [Planctomycetia bacterium]|nr:hypothetical protein [Planctomycetia bacterium]
MLFDEPMFCGVLPMYDVSHWYDVYVVLSMVEMKRPAISIVPPPLTVKELFLGPLVPLLMLVARRVVPASVSVPAPVLTSTLLWSTAVLPGRMSAFTVAVTPLATLAVREAPLAVKRSESVPGVPL